MYTWTCYALVSYWTQCSLLPVYHDTLTNHASIFDIEVCVKPGNSHASLHSYSLVWDRCLSMSCRLVVALLTDSTWHPDMGGIWVGVMSPLSMQILWRTQHAAIIFVAKDSSHLIVCNRNQRFLMSPNVRSITILVELWILLYLSSSSGRWPLFGYGIITLVWRPYAASATMWNCGGMALSASIILPSGEHLNIWESWLRSDCPTWMFSSLFFCITQGC